LHKTINNLISIKEELKLKISSHIMPKIIAVSKTFEEKDIIPLVEYGHDHFGENKVQEAFRKWSKIRALKKDFNLHLIGNLQSNKVKTAVSIFDYIHSLDSFKLAKKIAKEQNLQKKKLKLFIQVNIGDEPQKSGINESELSNLIIFCKDLNLDIIGLMCIPPNDQNSIKYFKKMNELNNKFNLTELSMGMSSDYLIAAENKSTFLRIGTNIFGKRI